MTSVRPSLGIANYELSARLDETTHTVFGEGRITFTNPSKKPTQELYFHLYLNAFENEKTLFLRKHGGRSGLLSGRPGHIRVLSLRSPHFVGTDLWKKAESHSPGDEHDRTDIRVPLPRPLLGHETIELTVEFVSQLPDVVERTGFAQDFHLVAQWFPKLAKREPDGTWAHFAFHPYAEFYADFGNYVVNLDVPSHYEVGSTGRLIRLEDVLDGRARYRAVANDVIDFAWAAWPKFQVEERKIGEVFVRLLAPADATLTRAATWETLERGLPYLNAAYGSYPYEQLTVVQPPKTARRAGGMEYPQFITTGGSEWVQALGVRATELLTIHELSHQWFQTTIATHEVLYPFLDEGLTSYAEWRYLEATYGPGSLLNLPGLAVSRSAAGRYRTLRGQNDQAVELAAPQFSSFGRLASLVYGKTPLCLLTLRRVYGDGLDAALSDYARTYRFQHPTPAMFYAKIERHLGSHVAEQLRLMFQQRATLNLSVGGLVTKKRGEHFRSRLETERQGALRLPFEVWVHFQGEAARSRTFSADADDLSWELTHRTPIVRVVIDPERKLLLDENLLDNQRTYFEAFSKETTAAKDGAVEVRPRPTTRPLLSTRLVALFSFLLALLCS